MRDSRSFSRYFHFSGQFCDLPERELLIEFQNQDLAVFLLQPRQFFAHGQDLGGLLHRCDAFVPVLKRGGTAVPFDEGQRGVGQDAVKLGIKGIFLCVDQFKKRFFADCGMFF